MLVQYGRVVRSMDVTLRGLCLEELRAIEKVMVAGNVALPGAEVSKLTPKQQTCLIDFKAAVDTAVARLEEEEARASRIK